VWAERRAHERRSEDLYAKFASELIQWLRDRSKLSSEAAALSGTATRERLRRLSSEFPISDFVMRAATAFPEVAEDLNAWATHEMTMLQFLGEIADERQPFERADTKTRKTIVERGVVLERPILAALASARAQVTLNRPRRLRGENLEQVASREREIVARWLERHD
jgi:hypothetical protein